MEWREKCDRRTRARAWSSCSARARTSRHAARTRRAGRAGSPTTGAAGRSPRSLRRRTYSKSPLRRTPGPRLGPSPRPHCGGVRPPPLPVRMTLRRNGFFDGVITRNITRNYARNITRVILRESHTGMTGPVFYRWYRVDCMPSAG